MERATLLEQFRHHPIHVVQRIAGLSTTDVSARIAEQVLHTTLVRTPPG